MGLLSGLLGMPSEADVEQVEDELERILVSDENIELAFQMVRDLTVLTDRRLILVDKQGLTGKKTIYQSIPYRSIVRFTVETAGHLEMDTSIWLWLFGEADPVQLDLQKAGDVSEVMQLLAQHVC